MEGVKKRPAFTWKGLICWVWEEAGFCIFQGYVFDGLICLCHLLVVEGWSLSVAVEAPPPQYKLDQNI